jgi:hypothetical protein
VSLRPVIVGLALVAAGATTAPAPAVAGDRTDASCPAVGGRTAAPSPSATLGRALTARSPSPADTTRVLQAIDRISPRVIVADAGRSDQGRPLRYAIVGDPASLTSARRAAIQRHVRAIRAGDVSAAAIARAARGPAVVWLGGGVHANEPSGTTGLLAAVHRLATDDSCATRRILRDVLTVVMPDQNPDGHVRGTRSDASGFDLNRDWFAAARPESQARRDLLRRFPPVVAIDFHEQTGRDYFTPPYASPIVAGLPAATRRFADATVAPAVGDALRRGGARVVTANGYDLLYPGYADSATSLLFGSGGMTFEQGSDLPLTTKTARHATAALTALDAVARNRDRAVRAWADGYRVAVRAGARGRTVTGRPVAAWILRTDERAADARRIAERLRAADVEVRTLRRATTVTRYRPLGSGRVAGERLPAGTLVIPSAQPQQRWADVLVGREPGAASGADTWSLPRLAAVTAGIAESPIPRSATQPLDGTARGEEQPGQRFVLPGDSAAAAGAVARLLTAGVPVGLLPDGRFATAADAAAAAPLQAAGIPVVREPDGEPVATPLRAPNVVVVADDGPPQTGPPAALPGSTGDQPSGWIPAALRGVGVPTAVQSAAHLALGVRPGTTHVIVGPGTIVASRPLAAFTASMRTFLAAGGRLIAVGGEAHATLMTLGLTAVRAATVDGAPATTVAAIPTAPATSRALGGATRVVWHADDRLDAPAGAVTLLQTRTASRIGPAGTALAVAEPQGAGQVVTLGFSPVFRGQSDGGLRVLLGLLIG